MGLAGRRRPPLPAPTDSSIGAFDRDSDSPSPPPIQPSDLETSLTTRTDKSHWSIPDDGSPIVIKTEKLKLQPESLKFKEKSATGNSSQTSLLIEYFDGDKDDESGNRRSSVRVRVTPSSKKKAPTTQPETEQLEHGVSRRRRRRNPDSTRAIDSEGGVQGAELFDRGSDISDLADGDLDLSPLRVDLLKNKPGAGLDRGLTAEDMAEESRLAPINMSEVSSMPADSLLATELGTASPTKPLNRRRSRSLDREDTVADSEAQPDKLKPGVGRSRSLSRERLVAKKAVEKFQRENREHKLKEKEREGGSRRRSSRSASNEYLASTSGKTRRKSSRSYDKEDDVSNPSLLTGSNISGYSAQTTSSISKNPKLLQTVEDAIRRLILPEITALKNEQKSNRRSDRHDDELSSNASSIRSDGKTSRRTSGGKSGPKLKLNGDTIRSSKSGRRSGDRGSLDSLRRETDHGASEETVVRDGGSRRKSKEKAAKDVAMGAAAAGLTYAALKSKDSASSIERRERRKKRSKSHSRSQSRADSVEDLFSKHDVPPMPMTGGLTDSDLTRESILSERTSTPTHERNREVRDFVKDGPEESVPRDLGTPTRGQSPGFEHEREFDDNYYGHSVHLKREPVDSHLRQDYLEEDEEEEDDYSDEFFAQGQGYGPPAGFYSNPNYSSQDYRYQRRGLSPIQSVASFEERGEPAPEHLQHQQSSTSMSSAERDLKPGRSIEDVAVGVAAGAAAGAMYKAGITGDVSQHHANQAGLGGDLYGQDIRRLGANPQFIENPPRPESAVASLMDPSVAGDRSNLSYGSEQNSPNKRYSMESDLRRGSNTSLDRSLHTPERSSPLKRELRRDDLDEGYGHLSRPTDASAPREAGGYSAGSSPFELHPKMRSDAMPTGSPMPEVGMYDEVETNPSEIRDDPWDHKEAQHSNSAHDSLRAAAKNMLIAAGVAGAGAAVAQHHRQGRQSRDYDDLDSPRHTEHSESPGLRDVNESPGLSEKAPEPSPWGAPHFTPLAPLDSKAEGFNTGLRKELSLSEGSITPEPHIQSRGVIGSMDHGGDEVEDPFTTPKQQRPTTAPSDGMPSPLFDASTGHGMDRIKNQDIVALMDHLHVRDAQRNARDTEILVTLVRSAAEMRNSFEDMKRMMATQEEKVLDANNKQHMETRRALNGPRAMPQAKSLGSRNPSAPDMDTDDIPTKRRNLFRKALKGLGGGNKQDLGNIENMLMQLLDEVAEIRTIQQMPQAGGFTAPKTASGLTSYEQLRDVVPAGSQDVFQPTGQMPTNLNDSGYSSTSSYRPAPHARRGSGALNYSANRPSTVQEADEEDDDPDSPLDEREQNLLGNDGAHEMLTPTREFRGAGVTTGAPQTTNQQSLSADNTPNTRKHRSGSSSFFPKISRWSKTTASTIPGLEQTPRQDQTASFSQQNTPSRSRGQRPVSELSNSASDLAGEYDVRDHYDPHGDDRIRSKTSLSNHSTSREMRPPSPLIPSTVSEKPTYSAHRDSKDLQHPQPRQGPTARFQNHLEAEARGWLHADNIESPPSDLMGQNPVLSRLGGQQRGDRTSYASATGAQGAEELGTINEDAGSAAGPPIPPKVKDDGPLVPPKVADGQSGSRTVQFATDRMAQIIGGNQGRKPSGPRPITRTGSSSPAQGQSFADWKRHQYVPGPDHIPSDVESETF